MNRRRHKNLRVLLVLLLWAESSFAVTPLSDLALEEFPGGPSVVGNRNPFLPLDSKGDVDVANLYVEGLILGRDVRLALLSGNVVRIHDTLGKYTVAKIEPGMVMLQSGTEEIQIPLHGFAKPLRTKKQKNYAIEFRNADIRDALKILAKAAGYNLIAPEDLIGRVNVSFEDSTLRGALTAILKVNNYSYALEGDIVRVGKPDQFSGGTDLTAITLRLKYATAKDLVDKVKPLLSDKGSVTAEDRTNLLSVKDYEANIESVRRLIRDVDHQDRQILIEAHIVDASDDFSRSLGIQWGLSGTSGNVQTAGPDSTGRFTIGGNTATNANVNLGATSPTSGVGMRIGRIISGLNLDFQITAAEQKGEVRIISKPTIATINNMPAKIRSGVKIHVKSSSNISIATPAATSTGDQSTLQVIETGVQLNVTPQITAEDHIKLIIETTESEVDFSKTVDGIPAIIDNTASTTVLLKNGETAVIGGLIKTKDSTTKKAVPGISKVPLVGNLFKSKTRANAKTELIIFITPKILD